MTHATIRSEKKRRILIVGRESKVAKAVLRWWPVDFEYCIVSLRELSSLPKGQAEALVRERSVGTDAVLWLGAILDPSAPSVEIEKVNFTLPLNAAATLARASYSGLFMTLGSALEGLSPNNPYLFWKSQLSREACSDSFKTLDWIHARTHTLVGETTPRPESFLGQLVDALRHSTEFRPHGKTQVRRFQDEEAFTMSLLNSVLLRRPKVRSPIFGPNESVNLFELASEAASVLSPKMKVIVDPSEAWNNDQTEENLVKNDVQILGGLEIEDLISRMRIWRGEFEAT